MSVLHVAQQSTFIVQVPEGVRPGQTFDVMVRGTRQRVTCPEGVRPGMQIRFSLPSPNGGAAQPPPAPEPTPFEKLYEVEVPQVRPRTRLEWYSGGPLALLAWSPAECLAVLIPYSRGLMPCSSSIISCRG